MGTRRDTLTLGLGGLASALVPPAGASDRTIRADLEPFFADVGQAGCFVLLDISANRLTLVNEARAAIRYVPASSFKIANSLIALETAVIRDENEVIPAGPGPKPVKAWEKDASIRDGIAISHVPIYQELARRIGLERYRQWLPRLHYGNAETGAMVDRFWLDGPLAVSALEQVAFVAGLAQGKLAMSQRSQSLVRDILRLETVNGATLYGKTGWTSANPPSIAWWVGWVERGGGIAAFAMNVSGSPISEGAKRLALGKTLLARLGAL